MPDVPTREDFQALEAAVEALRRRVDEFDEFVHPLPDVEEITVTATRAEFEALVKEIASSKLKLDGDRPSGRALTKLKQAVGYSDFASGAVVKPVR